MNTWNIYNRDCLSENGLLWLNSQNKKFQLIIADLPYGKTHNQWDSLIPLEPLWKMILPLLHQNGTILLFSQQDFTVDLVSSQRDLWRYRLIWVKDKGTQFFEANNRPLPDFEQIEVFTLQYPNFYIPQKELGKKPYTKVKYASSQGTNYSKDSFTKYVGKNDGDRYPTSVLYFPRDNANRGIHHTQKPKGLINFLIKSYTKKDDWVLDFCFGSGTTILSCIELERNIIGFEKDAEIFSLAQKRIKEFNYSGQDRYRKPLKISKEQKNLTDLFLKK
ncbi:MAG: site-specific DNA-methyltransferase [Acidithiobacillus sp.]|jgi:DNA modification methylase|uniref:DNA-methyltransferase n=1 Tax=Acidithiobacillus sp. TaxID=1872118 RepID=UPI003560B065